MRGVRVTRSRCGFRGADEGRNGMCLAGRWRMEAFRDDGW